MSDSLNEQLDDAVIKGNITKVTQVLDDGGEINQLIRIFPELFHSKNYHLLTVAAYHGHNSIVSMLLDRGADINVVRGDYGTALGAAAFRGQTKVVSLLLDRGADINMVGGDFGTALGAAAFWERTEMISLLLDRGADINVVGGDYGTVLGAAAFWGQTEMISLLLDQGADINVVGGDYGTALGAAAFQKRTEIISLLLDRGADINVVGGDYGTVLGAAAFWGQTEIISLLLDRGADMNVVGGDYGTALGAAAFQKRTEIISLLLDRGADINVVGGNYGTALGAAAFQGQIKVVQLLLNRGADINVAGSEYGTALGAAAFSGEAEIVSLLLGRGADINYVGGRFGTALAAAIYCDAYSYTTYPVRNITQLLLDYGADLNVVSETSYGTALGVALALALTVGPDWATGSEDVSKYLWGNVYLLLDRGADPNIVGGKYGTPLGLAAYVGASDIVLRLLESYGGDPTSVGGSYNAKWMVKSNAGMYPNAMDAAASGARDAQLPQRETRGTLSRSKHEISKPLDIDAHIQLQPLSLHAQMSTSSQLQLWSWTRVKDAIRKHIRRSTGGLRQGQPSDSTSGQDELIARAPFPMPYNGIFPSITSANVGGQHDTLSFENKASAAREEAIEILSSSVLANGFITPEAANVQCEVLEDEDLVGFLIALIGLHWGDDRVERVKGWIQSDVRYFIERKFDFGTSYSVARLAWKHFDEQSDDSISRQRARWRWHAKQLDNSRSKLIDIHHESQQEVIKSPYSIMPRRIWDVKSNRVIEYRILHSAHLSMQTKPDASLNPKPPPYWAISHSWTNDMKSVMTSINQSQWRVPLPCGVDLNKNVRSDLVGYGAEYVWLDVLCLRQHSDNLDLSSIQKAEWKLDVATIGNIYRASERILRYFNGLGIRFQEVNCRWDDKRHWLKRAWTLQEIRMEHTTINAGISRDKGRVLMNTLGKVEVKRIVDGKEVKEDVEITLRQAIHPVLKLAAEVDSLGGCSIYELVREMAKREASEDLDRISGLFYLLRTTVLPCYQVGAKSEDFWRACIPVLPVGRRLEIIFDHPFRGATEQKVWYPTWKQILAWPERDPYYLHPRIESDQLPSIQLSPTEGELFRLWTISSAVLYKTTNATEYEIEIGNKRFGFYSPYCTALKEIEQEVIQAELTDEKLECTLAVPHLGSDYNWIVCEPVKQRIRKETNQGVIEYDILKKVGVLRTDDLSELLIGGENSESLLKQIYCHIV